MAVERWTDKMIDELSSDVKELTSNMHEVMDNRWKGTSSFQRS